MGEPASESATKDQQRRRSPTRSCFMACSRSCCSPARYRWVLAAWPKIIPIHSAK